MAGNISGSKSNIYERDWSKFEPENFLDFSLDWEDLLKIDGQKPGNSTKMYLDKIKIPIHLLKELINTS